MSRTRRRCKAPKVLHEIEDKDLHSRRKQRRNLVYNPYLKEYVAKRTRKKRYLQTVLDGDPYRHDGKWVGDSGEQRSSGNMRLWFQKCNSQVKKGDVREFQYDIANMADAGVTYFGFSESCINTNKYGYANKICDAFKQVIPSGGFSINNTSDYPRNSTYQPGGVTAGFDSMLRMRYLGEGKDKLGRWVYHEFGQNERRIRIYTVYRVMSVRAERILLGRSRRERC